MQILQTIIVTFFFLSSVIIILLVLIQSGKSGGMGVLGGGSSNTAFGSSTVDVVEKVTWWAIVAFFVLAILSAVAFADSGPELPSVDSAVKDQMEIPLEGIPGNEPESGNTTTETPAPAENGTN